MASHTTLIRGIADISCRPLMEIVRWRFSMSMVCCSIRMDGIGLTATLKIISSPFEIPARMPPELLDEKPCGVIGSLFSDPSNRDALKPAPISTPLTAPMLINALAKSASSLSKTGSPKPAGAF